MGWVSVGTSCYFDVMMIVGVADVLPIDAFVTYDDRQAAAARLAGLRTVAPG